MSRQQTQTTTTIDKKTLAKAFRHLVTAKSMTEIYEANFKIVSKYVHATSRGHEVIQIALGMQLLTQDYVFPYYRDDSILLSIGMTPYDLMLQVLAKKDDTFSGGRKYFSPTSMRIDDITTYPHISSATRIHVITTNG